MNTALPAITAEKLSGLPTLYRMIISLYVKPATTTTIIAVNVATGSFMTTTSTGEETILTVTAVTMNSMMRLSSTIISQSLFSTEKASVISV
jgi:hypothetical protein